jgi:hypothetical protein
MSWSLYDRVLNWIADHIFPSPHPMFKIAGYEIDSIDVTLAIYTLMIGIGLWWMFDNWLWAVAAPLSMIMASMIYRMLWGDA